MAGSEFRLEIARSALGEWAALEPRSQRQVVWEVLEGLRVDPRPEGALRLVGREEYRIRAGAAIVTYGVDDQESLVKVLRVHERT